MDNKHKVRSLGKMVIICINNTKYASCTYEGLYNYLTELKIIKPLDDEPEEELEGTKKNKDYKSLIEFELNEFPKQEYTWGN